MRWTSTAGPLQTKRVNKLLGELSWTAKSHHEVSGVIGGEERRTTLTEPFGVPAPEIAALGATVGERFAWTLTRENVAAVEAELRTAISTAQTMIPTVDTRITPEEAAERTAGRQEREDAWQREHERAREAWAAIGAKARAAGAHAVVIAERKEDRSDPMTDYHANTTTRRVAIGFRFGRREDFKQIRAAAERFLRSIGEEETIARLTEERDNYSMGSGNYISDHGWDGAGSGWRFDTDPADATYVSTFTEDALPELRTAYSQGAGGIADPSGSPAFSDYTLSPSSVREGYVEVHFPAKPSAEIIARLKAAGFRWAMRSRCWYGPRERCPFGELRDAATVAS